jgi:nitrogen regulatory protein P-II 1
VDFLPKLKIEMIVLDDQLKDAVATIIAAAKTGKIGDGKIFIFNVEDAFRIRSEDQGDAAI